MQAKKIFPTIGNDLIGAENICCMGAVVIAQLAAWSLPIPDVRGLISIIGKILYRTCILFTVE